MARITRYIGRSNPDSYVRVTHYTDWVCFKVQYNEISAEVIVLPMHVAVQRAELRLKETAVKFQIASDAHEAAHTLSDANPIDLGERTQTTAQLENTKRALLDASRIYATLVAHHAAQIYPRAS